MVDIYTLITPQVH